METLSKHFHKLTQAALQKHGFAQADILSHWSSIVGSEVSSIAVPEQIKWPGRNVGERSQGGTLVLKANPGRMLDVQYSAPQIIDRINSFFGYPAIGAVKVKQADRAVVEAQRPRRPEPEPSAAIQEQVGIIENDDLKRALARLGAQISAKR